MGSLTPLLGVFGFLLWSGNDSLLRSYFKAAMRQQSTPRAEAADEVERVFADLVALHGESRGSRRLVIVVDDVDRLGAGDVLDALRAVKSLQAVPKGREPIFVVSCDEKIVLDALRSATSTSSTAESLDQQAGLASSRDDGSEAAAKAYLDKFFTVRVPLPPHIPDDMLAFAQAAIPEDHPIRQMLSDRFPEVVLVLARGDVDDPRHMIRRLNAFLSRYRLAERRERDDERRLHPGDVTGRPQMLARLVVLAADFPTFYEKLLRDEGLLSACDRLLLGQSLDDAQCGLLERHGHITEKGEWHGDSVLRNYLVATARHVAQDTAPLVPILYLSDTESARLLGNERIRKVHGAARRGDSHEVEEGLVDLDDEQRRAVAKSFESLLENAQEVELPDVLAGVRPAVTGLGESNTDVAAAAALAVNRCDPADVEPELLVDLLETAPDGHREALLDALIADDADDGPEMVPDARRHRMLVAGRHLARHPESDRITEALSRHLAELHQLGGWSEVGSAWLTLADEMDRDHCRSIIDGDVLPALLKCARDDTSYDHDTDGATLIQLLEGVAPSARSGLIPLLGRLGDSTVAQLRLAVEGQFALGGMHLDGALLASLAAASDAVPEPTRARAISLLGDHVEVWKGKQLSPRDEEEAQPVDPVVAERLATSLGIGGAETARALRKQMPRLAEVAPVLEQVCDTIAQSVKDAPEDTVLDGALIDLLGGAVDFVASLNNPNDWIHRVFSELESQGPLSAKADSLVLFLGPLARAVGGDDVSALADRLVTALSGGTRKFERPTPVRSLQELEHHAPEVVHESVAPLLTTIRQRLHQGHELEVSLHHLCALPWGADEAANALSDAAPHIEQLPSDEDAVHLAARVARFEHDIPDEWQQRVVSAVEAHPTADTTALLGDIWPKLQTDARARALVAGCGRHHVADELCQSLDSTALSLVLRVATGHGDVRQVLGAASDDQIPDAIVTAAANLCDEGAAPPRDVLVSLLHPLDEERRTQLVADLTGRLPTAEPETHAVLAVIEASGVVLSGDAQEALVDAAVEHLPSGATPESANLFGRLLAEGISRDLRSVEKELLDSSDRRPVGLAFKDGRNRKRGDRDRAAE